MTTINATQGTATPQASQTVSPTFDDSLVKVLNLLSGKKYTTKNLEKMKITEDVLYAALVYDNLRLSSPKTAKTFASEIKERFDRRTERNDRQPLAKAIDDMLDNAVDSKTLTAQSANSIIAESFGKAQLDKSKGALSRTARENGIVAIKGKVATNVGATQKTAQKFETLVEKTEFIPTSAAKRQRAELTKVLKSLTLPKESTPVVEPPKTNPPATPTPNPLETDKAAPLPNAANTPTGPNDFVFKPSSLKDGASLTILPTRFAGEVHRVEYIGQSGVIESLTHTGLGDDGRRYFRSQNKAKELPQSMTVRLYFTNGSELDLSVSDTKSPYVRSYSD